MAENTVGTAEPKKTAPVEAEGAEKPNGSEKKSDGLEQRFAELTGELNRRKAREDKLEKELADLKAKTATEEEKRVEELAQAKYGSTLKQHEDLLDHLTKERDSLLAHVPEEYKAVLVTDESIPVWKQLQQIRGILALSAKGAKMPATPGAGNPGEKQKPRYTRDQFRKWQSLSSSLSTVKQYDEQKDEMMAAVREGRVDGM